MQYNVAQYVHALSFALCHNVTLCPCCVTLVQAYKPGSTSPAAQLLDARDLFDAGNARSDKLLRQLTGQLDDAVIACATAAGEGALAFDWIAWYHPACQDVL